MAKDPAFNFYTNDFDQKTKFFTHEQVGMYLRLLMAQHQHGHLTEAQMMHICGRYDKDVFLKFDKDSEGKFFNDRLELEVTKKKAYAESRKNNRISKNKDTSKSYDTTHVKHMINHMENENEIDNEIDIDKKGVQGKTNVPRDKVFTEQDLPGKLIWQDELYQETLFRLARSHNVFNLENLLDRWEGWYVNKFEWKRKSLQEMRLSFESWIKDPKSRQQNGKTVSLKDNNAEFLANELAIIADHVAGTQQ
jgi:uncharacterized protein YdaU (DUF1376 family)